MPFCKILRVRNLAWDLFGVNFWSRAQLFKRDSLQKVDNAIHWINLYPLDNTIILLVSQILILLIVIYPVDI